MSVMKCPHCSTTVEKHQNFCGSCGRSLTNACPSCNAANPAFFKFCGNCGHRFSYAAIMVLDRAGIITEASEDASSLLDPDQQAVTGKPFSLFLETTNLVLFYSHWNELLRTARPQTLEVSLRSINRDTVRYAQLMLRPDSRHHRNNIRVLIELNDITEQRKALQHSQDQQDVYALINLMVSSTSAGTSRKIHQNFSQILEKICLLSDAWAGVICRYQDKEPSLVREFLWQKEVDSAANANYASFPEHQWQPFVKKLRRFATYEQIDLDRLPVIEKDCWHALTNQKSGAVISEKIYRGDQNVGLIALTSIETRLWSQTSKLLLRLAGLLLAEDLPKIRAASTVITLSNSLKSGAPAYDALDELNLSLDLEEVKVLIEKEGNPSDSQQPNPKMHITAEDANDTTSGSLPLRSNKDGRYTIVCPACGLIEPVHSTIFGDLGWKLQVTCACNCTFRIFRERRTSPRKQVNLPGYFARNVSNLEELATTNSWGEMQVINLSDSGLSFSSEKISFLKNGEQIHLKFNLDNSSLTPIEKTAEVVFLKSDRAGCRFIGKDRHDVTLSFYCL
jgi:hypothetical protein